MKVDSRHSFAAGPWRGLARALAFASLALGPAVQAEPVAAMQRVATQRPAPMLEAPPLRPTQAGGELLVMVCRRGVEDTQPMRQMQQMQQDLPMLCLATEADEETMQMGPERFRDLLEKAVKAGATVVFVVQRQ